MSPGRARSNAAAIAARPVGDEQQIVAPAPADGLRAAGDLVEDRLTVLSPRVFVRGDHQASLLGGDPAHHRPLPDVPLPRRAEHRDDAAAARRGDRREYPENRAERCRAVGIVDDDAERLAGIDTLHPAGTPSTDSRPARTAAGSRSSASPRATTASALCTLNRPASRSSRLALPDGASRVTRSR